MKQIYALLTVMMFAIGLNAQYIYNDYDANQNIPFLGWPNMPVTVANPDATGINTSANVAMWDRAAGVQYTNVYTDVLPGTIDFTTGTTFSIKVWSPIACDVLFKLEGNAPPVERLQSITTPNTWVQLDFDFTGETTDVFNKLVFFLDFASFDANTFYFDDIEGPAFVYIPPPVGTLTLPVTFDDPDEDYGLVDFGGNVSQIIVDPDDADNNVVETIKTETAETWAGTTVGSPLGFAEPIPFRVDSTLMGLVVWSPVADIPVRLKVEDANNAGITCETEALTKVAMAWDTLIFNFGKPVPGTPDLNVANTYNLASVFFNFGTSGADAGELTFYWDYLYFAGAKPYLEENVQDNFENDGWGTIDEWFFQDPDMVELPTTADPVDGSNTVADYNRSGGFPYANAQFELDFRMDLTERNIFELDVYFPSSNDYSGDLTTMAALKLQNSLLGGNAWTTQTEILKSVEEFDTWVTLTFDFSAVADREDYDQVVVQLGGEGHGVPAQFYFDNLYLKHVPYVTVLTPNGGEEIEQNSSYTIEWDYAWWDGDINIELIKEGGDPESIVTGLPASDSAYEWNVFYDQAPGEDYRIIITSQDNPAVTDTSDMYFTIIEVEGVQANFEADKTEINTGDPVIFTDLSSGDPTIWLWYFEGGTPETFEGQTPPEIVYENDGVFDVSLTVYNGDDEDILLKEDYIEVAEIIELPAPTNLQAVVGGYDDVQLSWDGQTMTELQDDFESYDDFVLEFMPWTTLDVDGSTTYGMSDIDWPNAYDPQAFIIFNPSQTTPPVDDIFPHSGDKLAACFAATTPSNDDWMITPVVNIADGHSLAFWAKSYTDEYGLERFRVGVSTTGMDPADFTIISDGDYVEAPVEDWTEFTYDLSTYAGQDVYVGIQCVSNDAFILLIDDVTIGAAPSKIVYNQPQPVIGKIERDISFTTLPSPTPAVNKSASAYAFELLGYNVYRDDEVINTELILASEYNDPEPPIGSHDYYVTAVYDEGESEHSNVVSVVVTDINELTANTLVVYPNPTDGIFTLENAENVSIDLSVIDITGKEVFSSTVTKTSSFDLSAVEKGIYFLRLLDKSTNNMVVKKLIIK